MTTGPVHVGPALGASIAAGLDRDASRLNSTDRWKAQFRFAGQTDMHTCDFNLPKTGQLVQRGETAIGTIRCSTPWQLFDNGLAFDVFENGQKAADGTLRP